MLTYFTRLGTSAENQGRFMDHDGLSMNGWIVEANIASVFVRVYKIISFVLHQAYMPKTVIQESNKWYTIDKLILPALSLHQTP